MSESMVHPREKTAQLFWTAFILMFFCIQAVIWSVAITVTARDRSHAVVEGYDEQALSWDAVKSAQKASAALGWKIQIVVNPQGDIRGNRVFTILVVDREGKLVTNAAVRIRAFHRAAAGEPQDIQLQEIEPGLYSSTLTVKRFGKWCFTGSISIDEKVFLLKQTISLNKAEGN